MIRCETCHGSGFRPGPLRAVPCLSCRGTGSVPLVDVTRDHNDDELDRLAELVATQAAEIAGLKKRIAELESKQGEY